MNRCDNSTSQKRTALCFELGTFEGFNFRDQSAIEHTLTAQEVIDWDHDRHGEAEFWPSGDHPGVALVFEYQSTISAGELIALDRFLDLLGGDSETNFLRIYHAGLLYGAGLSDLTAGQVEADVPHIYFGSSFMNLRVEAAYELFELNYPEAYAMWTTSGCAGLVFDPDRFLDSRSLLVHEITFGGRKVLMVSPPLA